ncbi:N-6 DNA methylase [Sedimentibacter sp. MB31-C6]|uniref:N-6 DNA methylase n=1 Tax=Sedimentibacter sp. MB31-C6 TaxID=3109366 RepID=UPI002DDC9178|nr:N-6 DNA methylase [Sedimentibacter sp. MB36-C1]WSI05106.1 N-6 DNA methylase [Sedimentibacter sp. MB36-C1]
MLDVKDIKFPMYKGLESQFEHNVYKYLEETIGSYGYSVKIKKTEYPNVDNALTKGGKLKCDAYIFNNEDKKDYSNNLIALFELESNEPTSKLEDGIKQMHSYCNLLNTRYLAGTYKTMNKVIKAIVYDGQSLCVWDYNIETKDINPLIGNPSTFAGEEMNNSIKLRFLDYFAPIEKRKDETSESKTINDIKDHLRANRLLQANKSFLMTILAAIYGKKKDDNFESALSKLEADIADNESSGILREWRAFEPKIDYNRPNSATKAAINEKLYADAKTLWYLSQNKNMDLYGFIYEELAEEKSKQDEGEYYTSRHIIAPIISSVLQKYAFPQWKIEKGTPKNKVIKTLLNKKIIDPFCGSGGFLYELLRFLKIKYQCSDSDVNRVANTSLFGFDKNDIMSAFLNMYLIGDGATKLCQVTSTINWQNMWNYEIVDGRALLIDNKDKLEKNITNNKSTFKYLLNSLINWSKIADTFKINIELDTLDDFYKYIMDNEKITEDEFFYKLIEYKKEGECVLKYLYDLFIKCSQDKTNCPSFLNFKNNLGNTDLLITNIPYGSIDDARLTTKEKGTLESLSLKQCIDMLTPSTFRNATYNEITNRYEDDVNGKPKSNFDGGIATIILPNGIFESETNKELRDYLFSRCNILSVIKLPTLTFAPYASIQTFVITIQKKSPFEYSSTNQGKNCFFYIVDNDGKANSKTRFDTELIGTSPITIKDNSNNEINTIIHEYLHDDFAINIEQYPEGYMSKLERAWIYGHTFSKTDIWNQKRYNEKWNGKEWEKITDTSKKWCFSKLVEKTFEKQIEKENKPTLKLFQNCIKNIEDFSTFDIEQQKKLAFKTLKRSLIDDITSAKVYVSKNGKETIKFLPEKISNIKFIRNILKDNYTVLTKGQSTSDKGEKIIELDLDKTYDLFENLDLALFPKTINEIEVFLNNIEEIVIVENEVSFFIKETYKQYTLIPENYLDKKEEFMSIEDVVSNIRRLRNMMRES